MVEAKNPLALIPGIQRGAILVVDDDPESRQSLCCCLDEESFYPLLAPDGESALALAIQHRPVVIFLDTQLSGIGGYETCRRLKAEATTRDIPVIFVGNADEDEETAFKVGGEDFITRPIHPRRLLARINSFLLTYDLMTQLESTDRLFTKYATRLSVTSEVGKQITSILSHAELTKAVVNLLQASFDYYFVSIWQLNDRQDLLLLGASTGRDGYQPFASNHTLAKNLDHSIIASVARKAQIYLSPDVRVEPLFLPMSELPHTLSELALPLHVGPRMVGVLDIQSDQLAAFDNEDCMIFQSLADQVAVAVRNAELYDLQNRRRMQAELLEQTGRVLSSSLDIKEVQSRILTELAGVLPYTEGFVFLRQEEQLHLLASHSRQAAVESAEVSIPLRPNSALWQMVISARPLIVDDLRSAPGWQDSEKLTNCLSWLGLPFLSHDKVIGILALTRAEACAFGPSEVIFLSAFAAQAAVALENAELYAEIRRFNVHLEELVSERTRQLDDAYKVLKKMDKAKADFIDIAAHELRTPLTVMKGYLSMLRADALVSANQMLTASVNGVWTGTNRLHEIVNSMLDVSKINNQTLTLACTWSDLAATMVNIRAEFATDLAQRNQNLMISNIGTLPKIYADPSLLYKVFYNLVVNAIKYTPDGGSIAITARTLTEADTTPAIEVLIQDTGIGIDEEHQALIFDQFYQTGKVALHSSGRSKFKGGGPGLGLAIARGIIQAHKGRVWVESPRQDEQTCPGSCFHVILPVEGPGVDPKAESQ